MWLLILASILLASAVIVFALLWATPVSKDHEPRPWKVDSDDRD